MGCIKRIADIVWVNGFSSTRYPKLKRGGLFAGHDYLDGLFDIGLFGVRSAADGVHCKRSIHSRFQFSGLMLSLFASAATRPATHPSC
jgi:hypothetical protein